MAKQWIVKVAVPREPQIEEYVITEGDDWDGRAVANEFDAMDMAYDLASDDFADRYDIEIDGVEET